MASHQYTLESSTTSTTMDLALLDFVANGERAGKTEVEYLLEYAEAECTRALKTLRTTVNPGRGLHLTFYTFHVAWNNLAADDYAQKIHIDLTTGCKKVKMNCFHLRDYLTNLKAIGIKSIK